MLWSICFFLIYAVMKIRRQQRLSVSVSLGLVLLGSILAYITGSFTQKHWVLTKTVELKDMSIDKSDPRFVGVYTQEWRSSKHHRTTRSTHFHSITVDGEEIDVSSSSGEVHTVATQKTGTLAVYKYQFVSGSSWLYATEDRTLYFVFTIPR